MTDRAFASWVEPVAGTFQRQREELVELVRSLSPEAWARTSPNEDWTYRDLLGHLATRDPRDWRIILTAVVTKTPLKPSDLPAEEETPINEGLLADVRALPIDEVARRIEADTDEKLDLLSKLDDDDQHLKQADFPMSLGEALQLMPQHEGMHMEQLRTALEVTTRTFAAWVEPVAAVLRDNRAQVLTFARAQPDDGWARPSGADGWTCKDVLAHLAGGNDRLFQAVLRRVIGRERIEASLLSLDTDGENARGVETRRTRTAAELIDDLQADGEEVQQLLSQLQDGDEDLRQADPPFILKGFVEFVAKENHDLEHLTQIKAALEGSS